MTVMTLPRILGEMWDELEARPCSECGRECWLKSSPGKKPTEHCRGWCPRGYLGVDKKDEEG